MKKRPHTFKPETKMLFIILCTLICLYALSFFYRPFRATAFSSSLLPAQDFREVWEIRFSIPSKAEPVEMGEMTLIKDGARFYLRTGNGSYPVRQEIIDRFFAPNEVQEIWLTFSDPQMKNPRKRLSSTFFLNRYRNFLEDRGVVHLKTDSNFLFTYTTYLVEKNKLPLLFRTEDLYANETNGVQSTELDPRTKEILGIHTYYENQWIERGLNIKYMKFHAQLTQQEPNQI